MRIWDEPFDDDDDVMEFDDGSVYKWEVERHWWLEDMRFRLRRITVFPRRLLKNQRATRDTEGGV